MICFEQNRGERVWDPGWKCRRLKIHNLNLGSQSVLGNNPTVRSSMLCRNKVLELFWGVLFEVLARVVFSLLVLFLFFNCYGNLLYLTVFPASNQVSHLRN